MENRPVFESFDEFIKFVYEAALNEEKLQISDFAELKTKLAALGLNSEGVKALGAIEQVTIKGSPYTTMSMKFMSPGIAEMTKSDTTKISSIDCNIQEFEYNNLLGGKVLNSEDKRVGFAQYLAELNIRNIGAWKVPNLKGKVFIPADDYLSGELLAGSGPLNQYIIVDNKSKLDTKEWKKSNPVKNQILKPPADFISEPQSAPSKDISIQYYFYYPVKIVPQGGVEYSTREVIEFVRPKTKTAEKLTPIVIQDNNTLFDVNKSVLKKEGKAAILAALSNVASANSITVTGGASQEGDKDRNATLCKERAKAVADYIKSTTSFKAAEVTVSPISDIQSKASTEDRKTWRRVTLNVDGEYLAPVDKKTTELVYQASDDSNKADSIFIAQAIIQLNSTVIA